jgi:alpha-glucosidase
VPIPWSGDEPPFGFGPGEGQPWIPQPDDWKTLSVEAQQDDPTSTLSFYREALDHRRRHATPAGPVVEILDESGDVLTLRRGQLTVVLNCGGGPVELPAGQVVLSSSPLVDGLLPPDTAAWLV